MPLAVSLVPAQKTQTSFKVLWLRQEYIGLERCMAGKAFTEDERAAFYNAIEFSDPSRELVNFAKDKDTLSYTDKIDSEERINGRPTDEELTPGSHNLPASKNLRIQSGSTKARGLYFRRRQ